MNTKGNPNRDEDLDHFLKPRLLSPRIKGLIHTFKDTYASFLIESGVGLRELMGPPSIESIKQ